MGEVRIYTYPQLLTDLFYFTIEPGHTPSNLHLTIEHNSDVSSISLYMRRSDISALLSATTRLGRHARRLDIDLDVMAPSSPSLDAALSIVADIIHKLQHIVAVSISERALCCYAPIPVVPSLVASPIQFIHHVHLAKGAPWHTDPPCNTVVDLVYKLSSVATHLSFAYGSSKFTPPTLVSPSVVSISIRVPDTTDISASDMQQLLSSYPSLKFFRIWTPLKQNLSHLIIQPGTSHPTLTYLANAYSTLPIPPDIHRRFPSLVHFLKTSHVFRDLISSDLRFSPLTVDLESWNHDLRARTGTRLAVFLLAVDRVSSIDPNVVTCILRHLTANDTPLLAMPGLF
jgi:hypothetical protein